jgi:Lrp/AsnC family transcriptional regulator for asnA, asnC and gidA
LSKASEAYVLINTDVGKEEEVLEDLKNISEVVEAFKVYGVYDILAHLRTSNIEEMKNFISWRLRKISNIRSTMSLIVV